MKQIPTLERVARALCKDATGAGLTRVNRIWKIYLPQAEAAIAAYLVAETITTRRKQGSAGETSIIATERGLIVGGKLINWGEIENARKNAQKDVPF